MRVPLEILSEDEQTTVTGSGLPLQERLGERLLSIRAFGSVERAGTEGAAIGLQLG